MSTNEPEITCKIPIPPVAVMNEIDRKYKKALMEIATGEGYYGSMAREYKNIAREALQMPKV